MRFNDGGGDLTGQTATEALAIAKTYLKRTIPDIKEYYIRYEMGKGGSHSTAPTWQPRSRSSPKRTR